MVPIINQVRRLASDDPKSQRSRVATVMSMGFGLLLRGNNLEEQQITAYGEAVAAAQDEFDLYEEMIRDGTDAEKKRAYRLRGKLSRKLGKLKRQLPNQKK